MEEKVKVCAYCRVSTNSKDQENSFENQKRYFEREINKSNDFELVGIYADKGITGTSFSKRQEFNRMLHDAGIDIEEHRQNELDRRSNRVEYVYCITDREPKFKYILTKNTSRFARNIEVVGIIRKLYQKGVYINFIDIKISTENDVDSLLLSILFTMDENESKDKSKKVKWGIIEGANNGKINANSRLYGYKYIQKENRLETIDEEAENIKLIFKMYSTNYGIRRIINYLSEHNINTRSGLDFSKSTVSRILQNEKYAGYNARLKYDTGEVLINKHSPKIRPKGEWIVRKSDKIPAIISIDLFDVCKKIRESKVNTINQKGKYKGVSEFAGLIKCSNCGNYYTKNKDRNRIFYNCSKKKAKGIDACNNVNINLDELNEFIEIYRKSKYRDAINLYKTSVVKKLKNIKNKLKSL